MADFAKGDVVQLKSGGPKMVVEDVGDYSPMRPKDGVKCVWFQNVKGVETPQERVFDAATLQPY